MTYEPNLRYLESHYAGRPYGYGRLPVADRSPAARKHAVSRPQLNPTRGMAEGDQRGGGINPRRPAAGSTHSYWDRFLDWLDDVPGTVESLVILILQPLKWLRSALRSPGMAALTLVGFAFLFLLIGLPLLSSTGGSHSARSAEGEQLMGCARDDLRVEYAKSGGAPARIRDLEEWSESYTGQYYVVEPRVDSVGLDIARFYVRPIRLGDPHGCMEFHWTSGESVIFWEKEKRR